MNTIKMSQLSFFKAEKYKHLYTNVCDFKDVPRPHSCMGLILSGEASFETKNDVVKVKQGDIIFVPITSEYISTWKGNPEIEYISLHFIFDTPNGLFTMKKPQLQKVSGFDFGDMKDRYEYVLKNLDNPNEETKLSVLSKFYEILSVVLPYIKSKQSAHIDERIARAIEYIEKNYSQPLSVPDLANYSKMSVSGFYSLFKKATGLTPIDYKNQTCIRYAMRMLIDDADFPVEYIAEKTGFSSSAYFRRTFKRVTGKTPTEYRKTAIEL
jgi:AraC-like DNA-binding protein